ncbi:MAG: NAD-dependent epimerase/dehydratase family protein [Parasphingorhabdus sp.]
MTGAKQKTIALTGATGFVGSRFLDLAVKNGFFVRALTRTKQDDRPNVTWVRGALNNRKSLDQLCDGAQIAVHIAGVVNAPDRESFEAGNVAGTLSMIEASKQSGVQRFIHISSLAATQPDLSIYGETKAKAEKIIASSGLDWTIVRPPWVYGPGDKDTLDLFKSAKFGFVPIPPDTDGKLSVIHVDDLCAAIGAIVPAHEDLTTQIFEIDDGAAKPWTQSEFAKAIGAALGKQIKPIGTPKPLLGFGAKLDRLFRRNRAKLTQDRVSYFCHDDWSIDPKKRLPEQIWKPKIDTHKGLLKTGRWYRQNDWL